MPHRGSWTTWWRVHTSRNSHPRARTHIQADEQHAPLLASSTRPEVQKKIPPSVNEQTRRLIKRKKTQNKIEIFCSSSPKLLRACARPSDLHSLQSRGACPHSFWVLEDSYASTAGVFFLPRPETLIKPSSVIWTPSSSFADFHQNVGVKTSWPARGMSCLLFQYDGTGKVSPVSPPSHRSSYDSFKCLNLNVIS